MIYGVLQIICGLCAFLALGQAVKANASKFDIVCGYLVCAMYITGIIVIQEVLK